MPSKTPEQERFMAAVAKSPKFAKKVGVPQSVGKEFAKADKAKEENEERVRLTLDSPGTASVQLPKGDPNIQKYLDKGYKIVKDYKKAEQDEETFDQAVARYLIKKD